MGRTGGLRSARLGDSPSVTSPPAVTVGSGRRGEQPDYRRPLRRRRRVPLHRRARLAPRIHLRYATLSVKAPPPEETHFTANPSITDIPRGFRSSRSSHPPSHPGPTPDGRVRFVIFEKCPSSKLLLVPVSLRGCTAVHRLHSEVLCRCPAPVASLTCLSAASPACLAPLGWRPCLLQLASAEPSAARLPAAPPMRRLLQIGASLTWLAYLVSRYDSLPAHVVFAKDATRRLVAPFGAHLRAHLARHIAPLPPVVASIIAHTSSAQHSSSTTLRWPPLRRRPTSPPASGSRTSWLSPARCSALTRRGGGRTADAQRTAHSSSSRR